MRSKDEESLEGWKGRTRSAGAATEVVGVADDHGKGRVVLVRPCRGDCATVAHQRSHPGPRGSACTRTRGPVMVIG
eukprot:10529746-Alexandrium_andersonii.AAC.2